MYRVMGIVVVYLPNLWLLVHSHVFSYFDKFFLDFFDFGDRRCIGRHNRCRHFLFFFSLSLEFSLLSPSIVHGIVAVIVMNGWEVIYFVYFPIIFRVDKGAYTFKCGHIDFDILISSLPFRNFFFRDLHPDG